MQEANFTHKAPAPSPICELEDCEPGTTYEIRLFDTATQETGPSLIIDTEQVGCTPGQKNSSCCVVL